VAEVCTAALETTPDTTRGFISQPHTGFIKLSLAKLTWYTTAGVLSVFVEKNRGKNTEFQRIAIIFSIEMAIRGEIRVYGAYT